MKALVVFHGSMEHPLSRWLKTDFQHVFCAVLDINGLWVYCDARGGCPDIKAVSAEEFDIAEFWRDAGYTVVETETRKLPPRAPFVVANCVGFTKALLGIRSFALTPFQLYKYLVRNKT